MSELSTSEPSLLGPVEIVVVTLPGSDFNLAIADAGIVTILDLVLVARDESGNMLAIELSELEADELVPFDRLDSETVNTALAALTGAAG